MHIVTDVCVHPTTSFMPGFMKSLLGRPSGVGLGADASLSKKLFYDCENCHYKKGILPLTGNAKRSINDSITDCKEWVSGSGSKGKTWADYASCLYHKAFATKTNVDKVRCYSKCQPLRDLTKTHLADLMGKASEKNCTFEIVNPQNCYRGLTAGAPSPPPSAACQKPIPMSTFGPKRDQDTGCFKEQLYYSEAFHGAVKTTNACLMGVKASSMPLFLVERNSARLASFF